MRTISYLNIRLWAVILIALVFTIIPLPNWVNNIRLPWVFLLVFYIQCFIPNCFHVLLLFFLGLCLDTMSSAVLGEHAFALLLTAFLISGKARRFPFFPIGQQMLFVAGLALIYLSAVALIDTFLGYRGNFIWILTIAVLSAFIWPSLVKLISQFLTIKSKKVYVK